MREVTSDALRQIILRQSYQAKVGHIGSSLSIADMVAALYGHVIEAVPEDPNRDRFVLSKGHAVLAVYAALNLLGVLSDEKLASFCQNASGIGVHPEVSTLGIDFSTGSLGQGLSMAAGAALAARLQLSNRKTYVLMSDAELNEGSVWEGALFASQHKLANLIAMVDANGQQAMGRTSDILSTEPILDKWIAFGWEAFEIDGHDVKAMVAALKGLDYENGKPKIFIARTTFGKGVDYMEGQIKWHYWPMDADEYAQAIKQVGS